MTKDRRLGRGLAALLGSPVEEGYVVEGDASPVATTSHDSENAATKSQPSSSNLSGRRPASEQTSGAVPASKNKPSGTVERPVASKSSASGDASSGKRSRGDSGPSTSGPSTSGSSVKVGKRTAASGGDTNSAANDKPPRHATESSAGGAVELDVDLIDNNPFQPRRKFNEEEIASLAESIRAHQQLQPVLVRRVGKRYQLISGERRLRATVHAGLKTIRAEIREANDRLVAELAIVENLQRKDLDSIEKALSFRRYLDQHKCTQDDLAKRLKIDRSTIANLMRLLELPSEIQDAIQGNQLTAGHARALLPLAEEEQQLEFAQRIQEEAWSVRETERQVAAFLAAEDGLQDGSADPGKDGSGNHGGKSGGKQRPSAQIASLEQRLRLALGTKAEIRQGNRGRGKIVINFNNNDEFERIIDLICPELKRQAA